MDAVSWLLSSPDPSVRFITLTEILEERPNSRRVLDAKDQIPKGPRVRVLIKGRGRDGSFGLHPYTKWKGCHWRLVSLVELRVPAKFPPVMRSVERVLDMLTNPSHLRSFRKVSGRVRQHASIEGNALAVCSKLGLARHPRVRTLVESLLVAQWDDGGWNCDPRPEADSSSFYETITPMWGLHEYSMATGDESAASAALRAADVFLSRKMFRSKSRGNVINPRWLKLHYPLYWHYDILHGLLMLSRMGLVSDRRAGEALELLEAKAKDGLWHPEAYYWRSAGSSGSNAEAVDWGRGGPNEMLTLNALRVLKSAGRM